MYNTKQREEQMGEDEGDFGISTKGRVGKFISSESRTHNCKIKESKSPSGARVVQRDTSQK